ncbi:VCBS repeat-containing protein [Aurantibacter sp.]|uniref:VCBS repeat-containing protein n=1 Tax=Aurantibacter sp. TaxID=2807103 RepID=UPI003264AE16
MLKKVKIVVLFLSSLAISCVNKNEEKELKSQGFEVVNSNQSGIDFSNTIKITDTLNYNTFPYIYMGGGVAMGDINNDGLTDVYLTGNMASNKLYLNNGKMKFEDISVNNPVAGDSRWYTGVTMVDINADGWLDIYLSVSGLGNKTENQLLINNGDLTFTEMADDYGIGDASNSIQATFFDYDNDDDLDLYVANYPIIPLTMPNEYYYNKMQRRNYEESGHLYRNNGDGKFEDVTEESNLLNFGLSLGVVASDFNNDGWQDLYVSNDFNVPDYFYINNGDGTFSEKLKQTTRQTSMFGMGVDAADFNNDGFMDLVQVDMTPNDHFRSKTNMASMNPASFYSMVDLGFHYQYMQNSLQVNNGVDEDGLPILSNVARLTGIATTDWSWAPLFADFDNDGLKDIIITNGMRLDVNNNDLQNSDKQTKLVADKIDMQKAPSTPIENYIFQNKGNYKFEDVSKEWQGNVKGFSNGVAYGDLDNDGDLDMVLNNIDAQATLLENKNDAANFLRFTLKGSKQNPMGLGAKLKIVTQGVTQWMEQSPTRGFQSSVEPILHFGLGQSETVDEVEVFWPNNKKQLLTNIKANQILNIDYDNAFLNKKDNSINQKHFTNITKESKIIFKHQEDYYDDFLVEPLLPHQNSQLGPALAVGDVNNDGLDDFFIGNAKNKKGALFTQDDKGKFTEINGPWVNDYGFEDVGAVFSDFDNDGDQDLYVVSGGNNVALNKEEYQDRIYINTANGFVKSVSALPKINSSGLKVLPLDFDGDGDLDIFVGGRIVPGYYLQPPVSYLLENKGGKDGALKFENVIEKVAPELRNLGMITDALWFDYNNDGRNDLIVSGEWMPITFFKNEGNQLKNVTEELNFQNTVGWWNTIETADLDNDGDLDIFAGNLGLNSKYKSSEKSPFEIYVNDFDENNRQDIVLSVTKKGVKLPVRGRECSSQQIPMIKKNFETYASFASAKLDDIYGEKMLENSMHKTINTFAHQWFENKGNGEFQTHELPIEAQISSINDIAVFDYNQDGFQDLLIAGNLYDAEVETPRSDAGIGLVLKNNKDKSFTSIPMTESGLLMDKEVKSIVPIIRERTEKKGFLFAVNNDSIQFVEFK